MSASSTLQPYFFFLIFGPPHIYFETLLNSFIESNARLKWRRGSVNAHHVSALGLDERLI